MRALAMVLMLVASASLAQVTRGGGLKKRAYQTYATATYYVDPTGSDSNACTASGTSACLTLAGALARVPIHVRHAVTVNVAAGAYAEVFRVQGLIIEGANGALSTAALNIVGTQAAFTTATGTNSGTLTGFAVGVAGTHAIATDSGQSWTVNDLRGRFLQIVTGTGSGQYMPIASNTATTISLASNFTTTPVAGSTYAIVTPGAVFTGTTGRFESVLGAGALTATDISVQPATGSAMNIIGVQAPVTFNRMRFIGPASAVAQPAAVNFGPFNLVFTSSVFSGGTNSGLILAALSTVSATTSLWYCSGTCAGSGISTPTRSAGFSNLTGTIAGDWGTGSLRLQGANSMQSTGLWFDCASTAGVAVSVPVATDSAAYMVGSAWAANGGLLVNGCGTGLSLNNPSFSYVDNGSVFTNVTNAIVLTAGARAVIEAGATFVGGTNFLTLDGTVYTDADLTSFTRITGPQGSYAARP